MVSLRQNAKFVTLADRSSRTFVEDNDTVIVRGYAEQGTQRVGFGEVRTQILPAYAHH